jgi:chaperonin GroES
MTEELVSPILPLNGNVLLKPLEETEMTYGNIVIPDMGKERPEMGIVVAGSPTYNWHQGEYIQSQLTGGEKVLIPKMGAMKVSIEGEDYIIIKESEILGVIK